MLLRQVQAHPLQGHHLRQVRRRGHARARSAASGWATSSWPARSATSGTSRARRAGSGILLDISPRNLERILYFALYIVTHVDEDARKRALPQLEDEAEGRGGKAGKQLAELEDELRADLNRKKDELTADARRDQGRPRGAARPPGPRRSSRRPRPSRPSSPS